MAAVQCYNATCHSMKKYLFTGPILYSFVLFPYLQSKNPGDAHGRKKERQGAAKEFSHPFQPRLMKLFQQSHTLGSHCSHTRSILRDNSGLTASIGCYFRSVCAALACIPLVFGQGNKRFNFPFSGPLESIGAVSNSRV